MKNLIALAITVFALNAVAGNEGPQGNLSTQDSIAKAVTSSFFVPPGSPVARVVDVSSEGLVTLTKSYADGRTEIEPIATLSSQRLAVLKANVEATQKGELVDHYPANPPCMDAPSFEYQAIHASGEVVELQRREGCKDFLKTNESSADRAVVNTLRALEQLSY